MWCVSQKKDGQYLPSFFNYALKLAMAFVENHRFEYHYGTTRMII